MHPERLPPQYQQAPFLPGGKISGPRMWPIACEAGLFIGLTPAFRPKWSAKEVRRIGFADDVSTDCWKMTADVETPRITA
jgi:hypothetical protein